MNNQIDHHAVLDALSRHIGRDNGIHAADLVREMTGETDAAAERQLRLAIEWLRRDGKHVCGTPQDGYYMASTAEELVQTCVYLHDRAMTSLSQVAAMRNVSLPDLRGQLRLPT